MNFSPTRSDPLASHWAISAIASQDLEHADDLARERLAQHAVGQQIAFDFVHSASDDSLLERVALAYEIAVIEGLDELSRPSGTNDALRSQAVAAASKAFDIRRLMQVPESTHGRIFFMLQFSALAYCGDRWSDLRRWYREDSDQLNAPSVAEVPWDQRILYRLFECWIRLFRKESWDDLDRIREIIAGLRDDQKHFEEQSLHNESQAADRAMALRLAALYHWAKGTEILAIYMIQGQPVQPFSQIDKHFESAVAAATASSDAQHEVILRWLHAAGRIMITNSLWWAARSVNSRTSDFVHSLTHREHQAMFELLPPQRAALLEEGLLDQAKTAIVIDLPTSGGKTLLAQFRILQALNQFDAENGWVAYIVPTRALSAQITRRLRQDFEPIGVQVEQLTAAVDVDAFEEQLLRNHERPFQVLVATPEKLSLVIRNRKIERPLALAVMDEAHNLETTGRGLRIELLLATIRHDCPTANFLLLMPFVEDTETIARWLAQDIHAGQAISLGTTPWKPNERIIGLYRAVPDDSKRAGWHLIYETLTSTPKAMPLRGTHRVGGVRPIDVPKSKVINNSKQTGFGTQTAAMASVMAARGTSIAVTTRPDWAWEIANQVTQILPPFDPIPSEISLVQDFLRTEISPDFLLVKMLECGVGTHHAGLSDEIRALMEWLAEIGKLRVLCATTTIAQGINFPVSSIFLAGTGFFDGSRMVEMGPREFWNLAGRAGRIDQDSVGVVGLAEGQDKNERIEFIRRHTGALVSRLVVLLEDLAEQGKLANLSELMWQDQWEDFRCYVAHLWAEKKNLDAVLRDSEQLLRQTYGYTVLRNDPTQQHKAEALLKATRTYAHRLAKMPQGVTSLADSTGFSPEGVAKAMIEMGNLERKLTPSDWRPESLFGEGGKIADIFGVMLKVPQLKRELEEIGGKGFDRTRISEIARDWVNGKGLSDIAQIYFNGDGSEGDTTALTNACRAIYRAIVNNGTWGVSALSRMTGVDIDSLTEAERRQINTLPAMIYHGVRTEEAVLMRMNAAPRSVAESLGSLYREISGDDENRYSVDRARSFLRELDSEDWNRARPTDAALSGSGYKRIWEILSGSG